MTSVIFFPVARRLSDEKTYMTALLMGESMTGLLTSALSTLQSVHDCKIISIKTFFVILSVVVIVATLSFRYIETRRTISMTQTTRNAVPIIATDVTRLFIGQAALAFVENGLHTALLPHALSSFPNSQTNISIATKLGTIFFFLISSLSLIEKHAHCRLCWCKSEHYLCTFSSVAFQSRMDNRLCACLCNECVDDCIERWCVHPIERVSVRGGCCLRDCAV